MRVFDFDNTVYNGESALDFFIYYLKKFPLQVAKYIPEFARGVIKYKRGSLSIDEALQSYSSIFKDCCRRFDDIPAEIERFWDKNAHNVKQFYLDMKQPDDVILSASPEVVLKVICSRIGVKNVIGSQLDIEKGEIHSICYRENKIGRFKEHYPDTVIDEFYTDSFNDKPFMDISNDVYLVKKNKIKKIKENGKYLINI
ncbi:MAG: haloacid dehalogenase-like hydrolase [Clostridia bacterium]|nr:haloacid dehalogenase-like hydrolase [Clostridia bacterium]